MDFLIFSSVDILLLAFCLGFIFQVFFYAKEQVLSKWFWIGFFVLLVLFFIPSKEELITSYNLMSHVFMFTIFFGLIEGFILRDKILFKLTEFKLLVFQLIFIYLAYILLDFNLFLIVLIPIGLVFLISIVMCVTPYVPGNKGRLLLYVWFLINWIFCALFVFSKFFLGVILKNSSTTFSPLEYFLFGFSSYLIVIIAFFLFGLLPIPGKHESLASAIKRSKEMANAMIAKFDDTHAGTIAVVIAIIVVGGGLIVNVIFKLIDPISLVALFLTLSVVLNYIFTNNSKKI